MALRTALQGLLRRHHSPPSREETRQAYHPRAYHPQARPHPQATHQASHPPSGLTEVIDRAVKAAGPPIPLPVSTVVAPPPPHYPPPLPYATLAGIPIARGLVIAPGHQALPTKRFPVRVAHAILVKRPFRLVGNIERFRSDAHHALGRAEAVDARTQIRIAGAGDGV